MSTRQPTKRETRLLDAIGAIEYAAREIDMDWPASALDDPMLDDLKRDVIRSRRYYRERLLQVAKIVEAILLDADGFALLIELRQKKPGSFIGIVALAKVELGLVPPQDAEKAAA